MRAHLAIVIMTSSAIHASCTAGSTVGRASQLHPEPRRMAPSARPPVVAENAGGAVDLITRTTVGWRLDGTARLEHDGLRFQYCCVNTGTAERALPEITQAGSWELAFDHTNSECAQAVHAFLYAGDHHGPEWVAHRVLDAHLSGTVSIVFEVAPKPPPMRLRLIAEGGLECCGTTTIHSILLHRRPDPF